MRPERSNDMKQEKRKEKVFILGLVSSILLLLAGQTLAQGTFTATGSMTTPRWQYQTATLLADGKVLITGGLNTSNWWDRLASAEVYDPISGIFTPTGSMTSPRQNHTATLLTNGKVLIAGGYGPSSQLSSAELYDPVSGTFTPTGSMTTPRSIHVATLLANGKALVVGGQACSSPGCGLASAELYDPATGTFSATGSMSGVRQSPTATLLANGKVLIAGGDNEGPFLASAELFDPATGTFTPTGSMSTPRGYLTATLLNNGKVLVAGGADSSIVLASAELYDPATGFFTPTGSMSTPRIQYTATLLNNGEVLVVGGYNGSVTVASAELYDPLSGTFTSTVSMSTPRLLQTATLLDNGKVLVAGGGISQNNWAVLDSAELYTYPNYVFSGFFSPVDNIPTVNTAKAGQTIPFKWQITDSSGVGISDPSSFAGLSSYPISCGYFSYGVTDAIEEVASGNSSLQYLGDGYWQFNWKTPKTYLLPAQQCRVVMVNLSDGISHYAFFTFNR